MFCGLYFYLCFQCQYFKHARVAQWIEQQFPKLLVVGSTPIPGTIF